MNNQELLIKYIHILQRKKLLTKFISYIFDYHNLHDYNYMFRIKKENNNIQIDIYDNISINKLNRYIFDYSNSHKIRKEYKKDGINITYIFMQNINNNKNKLYKFAYLFTLNKDDMLKFANTFLKQEFTEILIKVIK